MSCIVIAEVMKKITIDPSKYLEVIGFLDLHGYRTIPSLKEMSHPNFHFLSLEEMSYPNYPDNCWALDVARQANATPLYIFLGFKPVNGLSADIFVEDRLLSLKKSSTYSKFSSSGPRITRENGEFVGYALEIEQEIFDERDANFGCENYPTESYSTYQDCDQNLTRKWIASLVSDFIPVWASNSLNEKYRFYRLIIYICY